MKISELIGRLQNTLSEVGDLEVLVDYVDVGEIAEFRHYKTKERYVNIKPAEVMIVCD